MFLVASKVTKRRWNKNKKNDSRYWMIERYRIIERCWDMILYLKEVIIRVTKKLWCKDVCIIWSLLLKVFHDSLADFLKY